MAGKKGFTFLELLVVIIIIGILASLGIAKYTNLGERFRGAEAKAILGDIRKFAAVYYVEKRKIDTGFAIPEGIPTTCEESHYFQYSYIIPAGSTTEIEILAIRCAGDGKLPAGDTENDLMLKSNFSNGIDEWTGYYK